MVLGIRYLTGYCVARDLTRQQAEWPPHPARIFMAMAAAHFESGADAVEREALLWLEKQPPPRIFASAGQRRSVVETYVPVNDQHGGIVKRPRQARSFPAVRPDLDSVYLCWRNEPESPVREAIGRICAKVTRVGHSSSLVQLWILDPKEPVEANWEPDETKPNQRLRVPESGLLEYLDQAFNGSAIEEFSRLTEELALAKGKAKAALKKQLKERFGEEGPQSSKPLVNNWQGYRDLNRAESAEKGQQWSGPFDPEFIVLNKFEGPVLGLESTLQLTGALRNTLLKACPQPQPEWITGHAADGAPSKHPHVAFFPLPFVGSEHADGHVMGLGMTIPKELVGEIRPREQALRECIGPLFFNPDSKTQRRLRLWKNDKNGGEKAWEWKLERELREDAPVALNVATWTGPSKRWASVTPVVLHHYPKKGDSEDVERIIREAFKSALFPEPESIQISVASAHIGGGSLRDVPSFPEGEGLTRYQTHVVVSFAEDVTGPMLVGRGRFRGYGLFRPYFRRRDGK